MIRAVLAIILVATFLEPATALENPRVIAAQITVDVRIAEVWQDWSTAEGQQGFFGPKVILELTTNGLYEVHFLPDAEPGGRGHEDGRILGFQNERMLSFTWSMPPYIPEIRPHHTYIQMWFDKIDDDTTQIRLYHQGFGEGEKWDQGFGYFTEVWPNLLARYKAHVEGQ